MDDFTVIKCDAQGQKVLSYTGRLLKRGEHFICIEATFTFNDRDLGYVVLKKGDVFHEWFYSDRWYNIFRVQDVDTHQLKGWYCNITRPADINENQVASDDLALDVFVYPNGRTLLLDEDEFSELPLSKADRQNAREAVDTIHQIVSKRQHPFDEITHPYLDE